jgi:D-3-phosphoglycerate dehydrogenase
MRIVATADMPAVAREAFAPMGEILVRDIGARDALADAEVLIVRGAAIDEPVLARSPRLRAIARTGAGYDNLDVAAATARGIPIVYAPGVGSGPIAEGAVALVFAATKRLRELGAVVHGNAWHSRYEVVGLDLDGTCIGIVGLGAVGRRVARLSGALGMRVIAHDPAVAPGASAGVEIVPLAELLDRAEVISLHCALTDQTRGLVDRDFLARVREGAVLVNVARGPIVESEEVLAEALESGRLGGVALDVFPSEPPPTDHRLYSNPRVVCTPHSVGLTARWNREVFASLASGVSGVLAGRLPPNVLNPEAVG